MSKEAFLRERTYPTAAMRGHLRCRAACQVSPFPEDVPMDDIPKSVTCLSSSVSQRTERQGSSCFWSINLPLSLVGSSHNENSMLSQQLHSWAMAAHHFQGAMCRRGALEPNLWLDEVRQRLIERACYESVYR